MSVENHNGCPISPEYLIDNRLLYIGHFAGLGKWLTKIDMRLLNEMLVKRKYKTKQLLAIQNFIECEAHRELLLAGLKIERNRLYDEYEK